MSYERHDGLGFASAFASMPIAPQPTEEPSAPTGVRIPAAMMAAASMFSPTAQVTVPLNERRAFLRWYSNVQGPATGFRAVTAAPSSNPTHAELVAQAEAEEAARRKAGALRLFGSMRGLGGVSTDAAGVVTTTRGEYMRFKGARQRIGTLLEGLIVQFGKRLPAVDSCPKVMDHGFERFIRHMGRCQDFQSSIPFTCLNRLAPFLASDNSDFHRSLQGVSPEYLFFGFLFGTIEHLCQLEILALPVVPRNSTCPTSGRQAFIIRRSIFLFFRISSFHQTGGPVGQRRR